MTTWKLNGYALQGVLGRGGSGEVWRAREVRTGLPVALKRVDIATPEQLRHALAEGALLAQLDHPNLIRVREVLTGRDWVVLVLDLADGGSLADLLRRRDRLTPGEVASTLAPIGAAVAYLHADGIVHGDVSSGNILFSRAGLPLLADLGIARILGDEAPIRTTAAYVDPAVAAGCAPGAASDVFGLGAVAVHALSGEPLWGAGSSAEMLRRAADGVTADPAELARRMPGVGSATLAVLSRALAPEPAARCTAAEFALDLRHSCDPLPIELSAGRPWTSAAAGPAGPQPARASSHLAKSRNSGSSGAGSSAARSSVPGSSVVGRHRLGGPTLPVPEPGRPSFDRPGLAINFGDRPEDRGLLTHGARVAPPPVRSAGRRGHGWGRRQRGGGQRNDGQRGGLARAVDAIQSGPRPRRWRLKVLVSVLAAAGIGVAAPVWMVGDRGSAGRAVSAPSAPSSSAPSSPSRVAPASQLAAAVVALRALDGVRQRAFAERNPGLLHQIYPPGPLLDGDSALLLRSVPIGCGLRGVRTSYQDVTLTTATSDMTVLTVRASLPRSTLICPGAPSRPVPGVETTAMRIDLARAGSGYRIAAQRLLGS